MAVSALISAAISVATAKCNDQERDSDLVQPMLIANAKPIRYMLASQKSPAKLSSADWYCRIGMRLHSKSTTTTVEGRVFHRRMCSRASIVRDKAANASLWKLRQGSKWR